MNVEKELKQIRTEPVVLTNVATRKKMDADIVPGKFSDEAYKSETEKGNSFFCILPVSQPE
ncbi:hypothetical protein [Desulfonema magnum]|uniref:Uncharacterized protein n=1 Tax=Desulfonema magnum TaxID=45655 RepID=A0A975BKW7_9BACT|nr:hypothetical protein [Desulfonema magnum]QTA87276.1 Uncharacterized protein dnm_033060 [Desulfonema magnum]